MFLIGLGVDLMPGVETWLPSIIIWGVALLWLISTVIYYIRHRIKPSGEANKRVLRETLAKFLDEGQNLKRQCANEREAPPNNEADEWAQRTEHYLEGEFDKSYISRFRSSIGVPLTANSIASVPHRNLWAGIHNRLYQLGKFIEQLGD